MPVLEKISQQSQARHWTDSIPLEYHYTAGVAGEEFRRELKEHGRFLGSKCSKCKSMYLPARMFCPSCFIEMKETKPLEGPWQVYSFTIVNKDRSGNSSRSMTIGLVKIEGVKGGIVHQLEAEDSAKVTIGMKVVPVLKSETERTGALTDIIAFKAA